MPGFVHQRDGNYFAIWRIRKRAFSRLPLCQSMYRLVVQTVTITDIVSRAPAVLQVYTWQGSG